ncbi:MAG: ROK family protein [Acidobacteriota bacterium]|nr:ROK family protein [Acidobacteriota bacterium]
MAVYVTGDIHGWLDIGKLTPERWPTGATLRRSDFLVICGDFGLVWTDPPTLEEKFFLDWLDSRPWTTLFIDGNHENYALLDSFPTCEWRGGKVSRIPGTSHIIHLLRGQVYEMGKFGRWFCMGGAASHDVGGRVEGLSWWPREMPSQQEYAEALANLERVGWEVDYVFTHEVPRKLRRHAMVRHYDPSREQDDELTAFLQMVDDRLDKRRLKVWYAGHYHDDMMLRDRQHAELYNQIVELGKLPDGSIHRHLPYCKESWIGVGGAGQRYREWVLSRQIEGCTITWEDNEHICLATNSMFGKIIFHQRGDDPEIVEMRITRKADGAPMFRVRFELSEELRAKELFLEMAEVLDRTDIRGMTRVLLCCAAGVTTVLYERRLTELAERLSLNYDFSAMPLDDAIARNGRYDVVMVAPQMGYRYKDAVKAFPNATVIEIPDEIFATFDVRATLRLLLDAMSEGIEQEEAGSELAIVRPIDSSRSVMVVTVIRRVHSQIIGYRVFVEGRIVLDSTVYKRHVDFRDIEDVLATVGLDGIDVSALDAIGIALPGIINRNSISMPSSDIRDYDQGRMLKKRYGIEVYVDNSSNAAVMGCYMSQVDYDTVVFHVQRTGHLPCGEGIVVDGHMSKGRLNYGGELSPLTRRFKYSGKTHEMVWTYEGMREIVASYLVASICTVAPDAIYVACALVNDMDALRQELAKTIPEPYIPDLIWVEDHRELVFLGELALCVEKLTNPRPHRKW